MATAASRPGRWLSHAAYRLQEGVEHGIVRVRSALDRKTEGGTPLDAFERGAGHFALGVVHGVLGMGTGVLNALGCTEQALTDPGFDVRAARELGQVLAHPVRSGKGVADAVVDAFVKDAPYSAGDFATLLLPTGAGAAAAGLGGAVVGLGAGGTAAACSPQPPLAIDTPDTPSST